MITTAQNHPSTLSDAVSSKPFTFVCGADDYLVALEGQQLYEKYASGLTDSFSKEIISGHAQNVSEVETAVSRFAESVQTLSLFGEKKVVWFKGINFLADSVTGKAEGTKAKVDTLIQILESLNPESVCAIITASPVDRRTKGFQKLQKLGHYIFISTENETTSLSEVASQECTKLGVQIAPDALDILLEKLNGNTRLLLTEINKLTTYLGKEETLITAEHIQLLVPQFGEGDFFEFSEAFFSWDLAWALDSLRRYFFNNKEARPLIMALQNRNRLLIQIRALLDSRRINITPRGIDKASLSSAAKALGFLSEQKSPYNVFTQNPWYLGKLAQAARKTSLRKLIDFQKAFLDAFTDILAAPTEQEPIMKALTCNCLSTL